jgi:hypothetical protein
LRKRFDNKGTRATINAVAQFTTCRIPIIWVDCSANLSVNEEIFMAAYQDGLMATNHLLNLSQRQITWIMGLSFLASSVNRLCTEVLYKHERSSLATPH